MGRTQSESIFNRVRMGYAVVESRDTEAWRLLLGEGLGMQADVLPDQAVAARMDERQRRLIIVPGSSEDLMAVGIELDDEETLNIVLKRLTKRGVDVKEGSAKLAEQRGVERLWHFTGPKGLELELFYQAKLAATPPKLRASGFITGDKGFGHLGISTTRPDAQKEFWQSIFDCRRSDELHVKVSGIPLDVEFFRLNERHHSFALVYTPGVKLDPMRTRIQHFEVQVASLDDMTNAYERCRKLGIPIAMEVGQHGNDRAISFYVRTPSGFEIEYGWNPVSIDETTWKGEVWDSISIWGHHANLGLGERLGQLGYAVRSLFRKEFMPAGF